MGTLQTWMGELERVHPTFEDDLSFVYGKWSEDLRRLSDEREEEVEEAVDACRKWKAAEMKRRGF